MLLAEYILHMNNHLIQLRSYIMKTQILFLSLFTFLLNTNTLWCSENYWNATSQSSSNVTNGQIILLRFVNNEDAFDFEWLAKSVPQSQYNTAKQALLENKNVDVKKLTKEEYPTLYKILHS